MQLVITLTIVLCFCCGCEPAAPSTGPAWHLIAGRDPAVAQPIYRALVPSGWQRIDASPDESLVDTTKPLCRLIINDPEGPIEITVHNFPSDTIEQRIPPQSQVSRWQRQLGDRAATTDSVLPYAHGGFAGLAFEADGVLAWSMHLAPRHYRTLSTSPDTRLKQQMRADYTIKAIGPESALSPHRNEIRVFARSFELIDEIPTGVL